MLLGKIAVKYPIVYGVPIILLLIGIIGALSFIAYQMWKNGPSKSDTQTKSGNELDKTKFLS